MQLSVGAAVGLTVSPAGALASADDVLREADTAMYEAKTRLGTRVTRFDEGLHELAVQSLAMSQSLRTAIAAGRLRMQLEPLVAVDDRRVIAAEALLRWTDDALGDVPPERFVCVAEDQEQAYDLLAAALDLALGHRAEVGWRGGPGAALTPVVSVNVSAALLGSSRLFEEVATALERHALPGSVLWLEITESRPMDDLARSVDSMHAVANLGVRWALDDFGTGYSSAGLLADLPVSIVKVDSRFLASGPDPRAQQIIARSSDLAHSFGMLVVAEGCESEEQLAWLRATGVDAAQGRLLTASIGRQPGRSSSISVTSAAIGERSRAGQRHVREQRVALELLDDGDHTVVAADPQVVALRDVVGEHDARVLADARQHRQQHVALQRLRLVDDDERVVQRPAADVGQRQHLEHAAVDDLLDDLLGRHRAERVEHGLAPGRTSSRPRCRAGSRAPGRRRRTAAGTPRPCGAAGARAPPRARRTARAPTCRCRPGRRARRCRRRGRAAGRARSAARRCGRAGRTPRGRRGPAAPACPASPGRGRCRARTAAPARCGTGSSAAAVERRRGPRRTAGRRRPPATSSSAMPVQPDSTASSARYSSAASPTADALTRIGRSLETSVTSAPSAARLRATARMRVSLSPSRKPGRQDARVGVVELDAQGAAVVADRQRLVEPAVLDPQVVEQPQRLPGEVAELGMGALGLELGDHDDREHDLVLGEPQQRVRVGEQDGGVEDVGAPAGAVTARAAGSEPRSDSSTGVHAPGVTRAPGPGPAREPGAGPLSARAACVGGPPGRLGGCRPSRRR